MLDKKYNINDILDKFVGDVSALGETIHDDESIKNLNELNEVVCWCLDKLNKNMILLGDNRKSVNHIAIKSYEILLNIRELLNEIMINETMKG